MTEQTAGQVVTFYSYKGGTGRSMAMANVACLLAQRQAPDDGQPVLAIDWDLEAPGLHRYFEPFMRGGGDEPGLIDLFVEALAMVESAPPAEDRDALATRVVEAIDLTKYIRLTSFPKLHFLRSGSLDADYPSRVNTFPWTSFFAAVPQFFRLFAQRLAREYSFVLIDSRTGVTDISGICTMLMPEKLVVVFTPNRQSLTGITALVRRAGEYRRSSDDLRPLIVFPLPSRIDTSFPELMKVWRLGDERSIEGWESEFQRLLRDEYDLDDGDVSRLERYMDGVQLPHVAQYAFGEPIAVVEERSTNKLTLANSYATLRDYLLRGAPWASLEPTEDPAELERKIARLEEMIRDAAIETTRPAAEIDDSPPVIFGLKVILLPFLFMSLIWAGLGLFWARKSSASAELLARVLQLDQEKVDPSTRALLLLEVLPNVRDTDRVVAVSRLHMALSAIPRKVFSQKPDQRVYALKFSEDGRSLLWHDNPRDSIAIALWSERDGKVSSWRAFAQQAAFADPRGEEIVTYGRQGLDVWWPHGVRAAHVDLRIGSYGSSVMSRDGGYLAGSSGSTLRIWETSRLIAGGGDARPIYSGPQRSPRLFWLMCMQATQVCGVMTDGTLAVVNLKTGEASGMAAGPDTPAHISPSGSLIGRLDGLRSLTIHRTDGQQPVFIDTLAFALRDFAFSMDEKSVVAMNVNGALYRFDVTAGSAIARSEVVADAPWGDARIERLADGRFVIWDQQRARVVTADLSAVAGRFDGGVSLLAVNRAGDRLAIAGPADELTVWDISPELKVPISIDDLIKATCERVGRSLTPEEWATYLPNRAYEPQCAGTN